MWERQVTQVLLDRGVRRAASARVGFGRFRSCIDSSGTDNDFDGQVVGTSCQGDPRQRVHRWSPLAFDGGFIFFAGCWVHSFGDSLFRGRQRFRESHPQLRIQEARWELKHDEADSRLQAIPTQFGESSVNSHNLISLI